MWSAAFVGAVISGAIFGILVRVVICLVVWAVLGSVLVALGVPPVLVYVLAVVTTGLWVIWGVLMGAAEVWEKWTIAKTEQEAEGYRDPR